MAERRNSDKWARMFGDEGEPQLRAFQEHNRSLPSPPRCKLCYAPFAGSGAVEMKLQGREPSNRNPNYCSLCDGYLRTYPGRATVNMTIVFVDVQDSTGLAVASPDDFDDAMEDFCNKSITILNQNEGFIVSVRGDGVLAAFPPGFAGKDHATKAFAAVNEMLQVSLTTLGGLPVYFRIGAHTARVTIGNTTGAAAGFDEVTVRGEAVNAAFYLCASAQAGEALVSDALCEAAKIDATTREHRQLNAKGIQIGARVFRPST